MLILSIAGNIGVAAYGVVANTSLVAISVFNGVSQGAQPLISEYYGRGEKDAVKRLLRMGVVTSLVLALIIVGTVWCFAGNIVAIFNSEQDVVLAAYGIRGIRLYFIGFLFAGINILGTGFLSAVEDAKMAFFTSILRGFVVIILSAVFMAKLFGMTGVWLAFPVAELITFLATMIALRQINRKILTQTKNEKYFIIKRQVFYIFIGEEVEDD